MSDRFFGWERATMPALNRDYPGIGTPRDLYDALTRVWSRETCTPRMRERWSAQNPTVGQCAVTAFLAQDIFGGKVYGIPLKDGGFHCFNVVDGVAFDLTCEQFGDTALAYDGAPEQFREVQFAREEKRRRYETLKRLLTEYLTQAK